MPFAVLLYPAGEHEGFQFFKAELEIANLLS